MSDIVAVLAYPVIGELVPGKPITTHRRVLDAVKRGCLIFDRIAVAYFGWPRTPGEKYADWRDDAETSVALDKHRIWYRKDVTRIIHRLEELAAPRTQHLADQLRAYMDQNAGRLTPPRRLIIFDYLSRILACGMRELGEVQAVRSCSEGCQTWAIATTAVQRVPQTFFKWLSALSLSPHREPLSIGSSGSGLIPRLSPSFCDYATGCETYRLLERASPR